MNQTFNYQAFIEKKNILTIDNLIIDIVNYQNENNKLIGKLQVKGNIYINNLETIEKINEELMFTLDIVESLENLSIENFKYQVLEGRGIELEFDFNAKIIDQRCVEDQEIKESIMNEVNQKLEEEFFYEEEVVPVVQEETIIEKTDSPKTSRIVYKFKNDESGRRYAERFN